MSWNPAKGHPSHCLSLLSAAFCFPSQSSLQKKTVEAGQLNKHQWVCDQETLCLYAFSKENQATNILECEMFESSVYSLKNQLILKVYNICKFYL